MNRWSKSGVLDRVFEELQQAQVVRIKIEAVSLDSTIVKVHPDGTGALKETARNPSANPEAVARWRAARAPQRQPVGGVPQPGRRCTRGSDLSLRRALRALPDGAQPQQPRRGARERF